MRGALWLYARAEDVKSPFTLLPEAMYSATMLRAEFPVHKKRILKRDLCILIDLR